MSKRPHLRRVLVANRGEIALRVLRACRELGLETVLVHSEADADSLPVRLADRSVCIGPARSGQSYLNAEFIVSAAKIHGADAIHPGYGFLSENADFARLCEMEGITFVGPRANVIAQMGDKVRARQLAPGRRPAGADGGHRQQVDEGRGPQRVQAGLHEASRGPLVPVHQMARGDVLWRNITTADVGDLGLTVVRALLRVS